MTLYVVTIFLWAATAFFVGMFLLEPGWNWLQSYNLRQAEKLSHHFRENGKPRDPVRLRRILLGIEIAAFIVGTLLALNPFFGLWGLGFAIFGMRYVARLLDMRELEKFDSQMIDIIYTMRNSLKAGMTLQQAMQMITTEFAPPASEQFRIVLREMQLGASIEEALNHLQERVPNGELKMMVNAIEILRQTGGNMVETFESLAETLKNRKRVEGKIKSLTAQGRIQAIMLCAMPFVMSLILYFLSRDFIAPLFNTVLGWVILTVVVMLVSTGWIIIQKVIAIEV